MAAEAIVGIGPGEASMEFIASAAYKGFAFAITKNFGIGSLPTVGFGTLLSSAGH
jgi:hypothetical protein